MNFNNCFTHTYAGEPLPPKRSYTPKTITPCAAKYAEAIKPKHSQMARPTTQKDADKTSALKRGTI